MLTPEGYLPRVVDKQVDRYLATFGAVEVTGTKWCGKTWTSLAHGASLTRLDDDNVRAMAEDDPRLALLGERPHVIDEWQRVPAIWDAVRSGVDERRGLRGAWILTGSTTPAEDRPVHSGAGRIGRIRMLPMTLSESGESTGEVSLAALFEGRFEPCRASIGSEDLANLVCRGGWPEAIEDSPDTAQTIVREYLRLFVSESVPRVGKNPRIAERLILSVARNLGQSVTHGVYLSDVFGADGRTPVDDKTLASYLDLLKGQFLVNEVPGWVPPARSPKRLRTKPKRYFADPSLAVAALGLSPSGLLADWQTFGLAFENLAMRDLEVYARALPDIGPEPIRYYRDDAGLEADAIVELSGGRWAAFEMKMSDARVDEAISSLKRLRNKLCSNPAARVREPEFMAVITGTGSFARMAEPGIYVIPLGVLGA